MEAEKILLSATVIYSAVIVTFKIEIEVCGNNYFVRLFGLFPPQFYAHTCQLHKRILVLDDKPNGPLFKKAVAFSYYISIIKGTLFQVTLNVQLTGYDMSGGFIPECRGTATLTRWTSRSCNFIL